MMIAQVTLRNRLLQTLGADDFARLAPCLDGVELSARQTIEQRNKPIEHVYFPESGIASVIAVDGSDRRIEAGPFGWEGMSGLALLAGSAQSPHESIVQVAGRATRMRADALRSAIAASPTLHHHLLGYFHAFAVQTAHSALAAGLAVVEKRLARWILMLHDRIDGDEIALTHDFMALMLAVRRPGVTVALHELEGRHLIRSTRGRLIVRDRAGLEALCGGFYGVPEAEYRRMFGEGPARPA